MRVSALVPAGVLLALALACGSGPEASPVSEPEEDLPAYLDPTNSPAMQVAFTPDFVEAHAVILWGSTDPDEAQGWLATYESRGGPTRDGFPRVEKSDDIALLNPGFYIVLAALPEDPIMASNLAEGFKALSIPGVDTSGAYTREVRVPEPEYDLSPAEVLPPS